MQAIDFDLYDKHGKFVGMDQLADKIAGCDPETQARFRAVAEADAEVTTATDNRVAAEQAVKDAITERDNAEKELKRVRPKISQVQLAKEFIASQRAE